MDSSSSASRGGSLRKEWRAVSETNQVQEGHEAAPDVDFCSITIDGSDELVQERIEEIARQREELQQMEIELRAQAIARNEVVAVRNGYRAQVKEHSDAVFKLKEQVQEREQHIHELEMKLEEKERELHAVKIDSEAAWAKEDLLREQNKELTTFRRERDNLEAERTQHLKQIHDLQEHIQEKESQFLTLEEQRRVAEETILYKDEQLREAQNWIAHVPETVQAELRDRNEQFNQYFYGLQRQFAEVEHHHLQRIQQLQLELAEARERNGMYKDGRQVVHESADSSSYSQNKGNQINVNDVTASNSNLGLISNGSMDGHPSYVASSSASTKTEHPAPVAVVPPSMLGMSAFLPPTQMTALHPYVMHPQGIPQSVVSSANTAIPQSHLSHFQPMSAVPSHQHWQNQQAVMDVSQNPDQNKYQPSQTDQNLFRSDVNYSYGSAEREVSHPDHLNTHINQQQRSAPAVNGPSEEVQGLDSNAKQYQLSQERQESSTANASFQATLRFDPPAEKSELKVDDQSTVSAISQPLEQVLTSVTQWPASSVGVAATPSHSVSSSIASECNEKPVPYTESVAATRTSGPMVAGKAVEPTLLDERSLLACIVRAVPAGANGRIRISSTLPNRLGKMLAPLHWHDYKKHYGKLDDFVAHHPELFVIEGDFIHLREGAQEIISATAAVAKVAAAAAASSAPYVTSFSSVALTPVAQSNRLKRVPSIDSKPSNVVSYSEGVTGTNPGDSSDKHTQISKAHIQQQNGVNFNIAKGLSDVNISAKSKNIHEVNGLSSEMRPSHSSVHNKVGNGANKGLSNGRPSYGGKQQGRSSAAGVISRR